VCVRTEYLPDGRSEDELRKTGANLLKGCAQHFRVSARRVSNISAIVAPARKVHFQGRVQELMEAPSHQDFLSRVALLRREYPDAHNWIDWWVVPDRAKMIFPSEREMDETLAAKLPNDTNPGEAQHNKLYHIGGQYLTLIDGLHHLVAYCESFENLYKLTSGMSDYLSRTTH
jgi:hypothetical protein